MDYNLKASLITPEKVFFSAESDMVLIPSIDGEMGVLKGHIPMVVKIMPGIVKIFQNNILVKQLVVLSGFAEITATECNILVKTAYEFDQLNKQDLDKQISSLLQEIRDLRSDNQYFDELKINDLEIQLNNMQLLQQINL